MPLIASSISLSQPFLAVNQTNFLICEIIYFPHFMQIPVFKVQIQFFLEQKRKSDEKV